MQGLAQGNLRETERVQAQNNSEMNKSANHQVVHVRACACMCVCALCQCKCVVCTCVCVRCTCVSYVCGESSVDLGRRM